MSRFIQNGSPLIIEKNLVNLEPSHAHYPDKKHQQKIEKRNSAKVEHLAQKRIKDNRRHEYQRASQDEFQGPVSVSYYKKKITRPGKIGNDQH